MIETNKKPWKRKDGWYSRYRRGDIIVEFEKQLGYGFRLHASAVGIKGLPWPQKLSEVKGWHSYVWKPDATRAESARLTKSPEAAMQQAERRAKRMLTQVIKNLTKVQKSLGGRRNGSKEKVRS